MSKSIPDRWLDYVPHGSVISGTRILAFKVPLKEPVAKNLPVEQRFTTSILMKAFPKMKYIIDLTNTTRYYDQTDFTNAGIKYQKVMIPGMQVPSLEYVKRFFKAIETFSQECGDDEIIGVHCTHGVNRAGYLICRYLVQQLGWKHADALKGFADARGYPIERTTYINDLKRTAIGSKIDVSKVNLDAPVKQVNKSRPNMKHLGHRPHGHFPPGPPGGGMPPRRGFINGGPFPPPPHAGKFGPPRGPAFGPPRPPPPMAGPPPPPLPPRGPAMFGPPRPPPRGPYGPPPPMPGSMRHGPPLPPPPPGPPGMRLPGPPRPPPVMGPPGPPPRIPIGPSRNVPPRPGPPPPIPPVSRLPPAKVAPPKSLMTRAGTRLANKRPVTKDPDFTSDDFEENLAARPAKQARRRPFPKN